MFIRALKHSGSNTRIFQILAISILFFVENRVGFFLNDVMAKPSQLTPQKQSLPFEREPDISSLLYLLETEAQKGDAKAQFRLGVLYANGKGVHKDYKQAIRWWGKSANNNYRAAQYNLGILYHDGIGTTKNHQKGINLLERAATNGHTLAQSRLADEYAFHKDNFRDNSRAARWYLAAANSGYPPAQYNLGVIYNKGYGVQKDIRKAFKWWTKASNNGHTEAQHNLAFLYESGQSTARDYIKAYKWYSLAAKKGDPSSIASIDRIKAKLNTSQLNQANIVINAWLQTKNNTK